MYENLATKYRPAGLSEVMGQETIKQTLQNAVKLGRVAHSYVFYGPRGCGKTTIARILAKTLNCHKPAKDGSPCGKCPSCVEIAESKSLDVIEIDAASNTQVDKVRSVIVEQAAFAPSRDKYKVYILDEVHMLSTGAFNALLKTVEEPPAHVVFIMATTEQNKVPATVLSRSQCFRFRPISEADIIERLKEVSAAEKMKAEPEALRLIARSAGGAMRDALTMLDRAASFAQGEIKADLVAELLGYPGGELVNSLALALVERDAKALHSAFDKLNSEGYDALAVLRELRNALAEAFLAKQGFSEGEPVKGLPADIQAGTLARLSRKVNSVVEEVKFSDSLPLAAEVALFTIIETPQDLEGLVRRLEELEGRLASGSPAPASQPPQKKNEAVSRTAPAAVPEEPPDAPGHESPAADRAAAWKKLLGYANARKPALYNVLLSVKLVFSSDSTWKLLTASAFEASMIENARPELEEALAGYLGSKVTLVPEQGRAASRPAAAPAPVPEPSAGDLPPEAPVEEADMPLPPGQGPETGGPGQISAGTEPELRHLNKVFHGRITSVKKVK